MRGYPSISSDTSHLTLPTTDGVGAGRNSGKFSGQKLLEGENVIFKIVNI